MIHLLATNGLLVSFNFMNFAQSYVDICSPPRPIDPSALSLFKSLEIKPAGSLPPPQAIQPAQNVIPSSTESGFSFGQATSTPAAVSFKLNLFKKVLMHFL